MAVAPAAGRGTRRRIDVVLVALVPLVMAAVGALHIVRAHTLDQSPWSGAGFGMFARVEGETTRSVRISATDTDGEQRRVELPDELRRAELAARVTPGGRAPVVFAQQVLELLDDEVDSVTVEVWGMHLERLDGAPVLEPELLREVRADGR
jgi:hypothetical protein